MPDWARLFDGQLDLPPGAGEEALSGLPARRGLALLSAEDGRPILLLPSADLRARVTGRLRSPDAEERRRLPDLQAVTRAVQWRLAHSHFETDLRFLEIARAVWPDSYAGLLAWKPAWFLRVDLGADYPYFARTQDVSFGAGGGGTVGLFGPFPGASSAQRYLSALADAFELCRDLRCLRQSPRGRRCSYGQMGKCLCPCDGTISSADYRRAVAEAADFVAGARAPVVERLAEQMKRAAAELQFERASALKTRLDRLAALEGPDHAHVAPIEDFRFLFIQRGPSRKRLCVFLADCASVRDVGAVDLPPKAERVQRIVGECMQSPSPAAGDVGRSPLPDEWAMGLIAHYLFAGPRRRGLILPLRGGLTADALACAIEEFAKALGRRSEARPSGAPQTRGLDGREAGPEDPHPVAPSGPLVP